MIDLLKEIILDSQENELFYRDKNKCLNLLSSIKHVCIFNLKLNEN